MSVFQCVGHMSVEICGCISGVCMWDVRVCVFVCVFECGHGLGV